MNAAAPDYVAPVRGWRTWRVDDAGPAARLRSVVRGTAWPVAEPLIAACPEVALSHGAPWPGCHCGIHAARDVSEAAYHAELPSRAQEPLAIGLVSLWGRVVEGQAGWRALAAYPESLYLPMRQPRERGVCERLAWELSAYGAPVEVLDCTVRSVTQALRAATPRAAHPLPAPVPV